MDIRISKASGTGTIHMMGRFDFNTHRGFKEAYSDLLQDPAISTVDVSLAGVEYMDSSALGMLLMLRERANAVSKMVMLSKPTSTVMQILDIANFPKLFRID